MSERQQVAGGTRTCKLCLMRLPGRCVIYEKMRPLFGFLPEFNQRLKVQCWGNPSSSPDRRPLRCGAASNLPRVSEAAYVSHNPDCR